MPPHPLPHQPEPHRQQRQPQTPACTPHSDASPSGATAASAAARPDTRRASPPAAARLAPATSAIVAHARKDETACSFATIPGMGPITGSLIAAIVTNIGLFKSARHFAAWLGLVPCQRSRAARHSWAASPRQATAQSALRSSSGRHRWSSGPGVGQRGQSLAARCAWAPAGMAGHRDASQQDGARRMGADDAQGRLLLVWSRCCGRSR